MIQYNPNILANECRDMNDIRAEIDNIDHLVIQLLATRFDYVKAASQFKKNTTDVQAKERFNSMLEQRKLWADELGLNGDVIKELYANLVRYFIDEELKYFNNTAKLFIDEFSELSEAEKDKLIEGVDRTPAQMIAYQLGWLDLVKSWDDAELAGQTPVLPEEGYKWNQLGYSLQELIQLFKQKLATWNSWIESLDDNTLFTKDARNWTKPYPSAWPVARFIHINSIAPFKSFRTKIRKWKKLNSH